MYLDILKFFKALYQINFDLCTFRHTKDTSALLFSCNLLGVENPNGIRKLNKKFLRFKYYHGNEYVCKVWNEISLQEGIIDFTVWKVSEENHRHLEMSS